MKVRRFARHLRYSTMALALLSVGSLPALAQDGVQLALLLFAHQQSSSQALTLLPFGA